MKTTMIDESQLDQTIQREPPQSNQRFVAIEVAPKSKSRTKHYSSQVSVGSTSTRGSRRLALAVDPYSVQRSVSGLSVRSRVSASQRSNRQIKPSVRSPHAPPSLLTSTPKASSPHESFSNGSDKPSSPCNGAKTIIACDSVASENSSSWHDERLMKSLSSSNTFQKRLEEQAAEAIRKAEEKTIEEFEKKLDNCFKTIQAIEKRKKNDLRLVELRKKTEMEKIAKEFDGEKREKQIRAEREEQEKLKTTQDALKQAVLAMKRENSEWQNNCRRVADRNKQLMAEIETSEGLRREVERHDEIVAQLAKIKEVFNEAHKSAVEDLERLDEDCQREVNERKKIQRWIASLIALMDRRCNQPKLLAQIHKINDRCNAQRKLVGDLRQARMRSSKRSQTSGNTMALRQKVKDMRKHTRERNHILEDRAKLTVELAKHRAMRKNKQRLEQQLIESRQKLKSGRVFEEASEDDEQSRDQPSVTDACVATVTSESATSSTDGSPQKDHPNCKDRKKRLKSPAGVSKKMQQRRHEIQQIIKEMRKLDGKDEPPEEIFIED